MADAGNDGEVIVVGAGAAGLAAARRLQELSVGVLVIEARMRLGGRARSEPTPLGFTVDLGCEWLHSADRNPWTKIAREMGWTIDENLPDWGGRIARRYGEAAQKEWRAAYDAFERRAEEAVGGGNDPPASALLQPGVRWNSLLNAISTWANGVELDRISVRDRDRYDDSGVNWRVMRGYGTLISAYGANVPVRLGAVVESVDHTGDVILVRTSAGTARARAVIITVPTNVLAAEAIRFTPALPEKIAAASGLPLGVANKLFLALDGANESEFPADRHVIGKSDATATGGYQLRPHGWPMISGYFGGALAIALDREGMAGMTAFAVEELALLFGNDIKRRLHPLATSQWVQDAFARGSYSYARPGHADDRARLAAPVDNRLFFAGEACSPHDFSTAHGAYLTGRAAADAVFRALRTNT